MRKIKEVLHEDYLRSLMFGLQDGIVSTTGVVVGISTGVSNKEIIILAALVAVTVEASSMAAGQYSSEKAVHQMCKTEKSKIAHTDNLYIGALIMFVAYVLGGAFSIVPTVIFDQPIARNLAIASSFLGLFIIGYIRGYLVEHKPLRSAFELFIIGSITTIIGIIVGNLLKV
ncbi:MAG: hypothetical protein HW400_475 [Candidatus Levybacteria bacterium]|nr:hypothetical protein [Candidatus Levybacteria bacterium]